MLNISELSILNHNATMPRTLPQARYWMLTIPKNDWNAPEQLPSGITYLKGQAERGEGGYEHWQIVVIFDKKKRMAGAKIYFPNTTHLEPTRSEAALEYVWKEDTRIEDTQFELGRLPLNRNKEKDWDKIWEQAKDGKFEDIPADVRIRSYSTIKKIRKDYERAPYRPDIKCYVFTGVTGSGKSHRAFEEASLSGVDFYVKGSTTKWWDGYRGESIVIMDEFRGLIGIEHLLKWLDKYPCYVEEKGGQLALKATTFYICSNLHPGAWYKDIDGLTYNALERRLNITVFNDRYIPEEIDTDIENIINLF